MRRRAKVDGNQTAVTGELRAMGVFVEPKLSRLGEGTPDYLCGFRGVWLVVELKNPNQPPSKRRLTSDEREWAERVNGRAPILVAETADEIVTELLRLAG